MVFKRLAPLTAFVLAAGLVTATASVSAADGCTLPGAHHSVVAVADPNPNSNGFPGGHEAFLGGNYIELGIGNFGNFGSTQDAPGGFFGTPAKRTNVGMSVDYDGFNCGVDMPVDFFLPGTPFESWGLGITAGGTDSFTDMWSLSNGGGDAPILGGANVRRENNFEGLFGMQSAADTTVTDNSTSSTLSATIVTVLKDTGSASIARVTQTVSFGVNDKYFTNDVTIENISGTNWTDVRYIRSVDPDNTKDSPGGSYTTTNTLLETYAADGETVLRGQATASDGSEVVAHFGTRLPMLYISQDAGSFANVSTLGEPSPFTVTASAKGASVDLDVRVALVVDKGALANGASTTTSYITSLDERDWSTLKSTLGTPANDPLTLELNLALGSSLAGASSTLSGEGLKANSLFTLTMYSKAVRLYRGRADASGNFIRKIKLPTKVCVGPGTHRLKLVGTKPDGSSTSATTYLTLGSKCAVNAIVSGGKVKSVHVGGILFARHSAVLSAAVKARLRAVAPLLKSAKEITLTGYTETKLGKSTVKQNKALAKRRAIAVRNYLRGRGVKAPKFTLIDAGPYNPTGKGQAANRRVIIKVRYLVKLAS